MFARESKYNINKYIRLCEIEEIASNYWLLICVLILFTVGDVLFKIYRMEKSRLEI